MATVADVNALDASSSRPVPLRDEVSAPFWEAASRRCLVAQQCGVCQRYQHPPDVICHSCASDQLAFESVSTSGTIITYTIMRESPIPGFPSGEPIIYAAVEIDGSPGLVIQTNVLGVSPDQIQIGQPAVVVWDELSDECVLPQVAIFVGSAQ